MELNEAGVVTEVTAAFARYEAALMANDVAVLNELFWDDGLTLRYGPAENLYGNAEIAGYRAARDASDVARRLERTIITTFGNDFATANTEFVRQSTGRRGRQSQTWVRQPEGWRIVAAHVSFLPD